MCAVFHFLPSVMPSCLLTIFMILLPVVRAAAERPLNNPFPMGINLTSVCYWSTENPFLDVFKQSQVFQAQRRGAPYGEGGALDLDGKGWVKSLEPGQWADTIICREGGHYWGGEYICLYDGNGRIEFDFDAKVKNRQDGRITLQVSPSPAGMVLKIVETDPLDPIRNIRLIFSRFEKTFENLVFQPEFLKRWEGFKTIRFMDWMGTNNSPVETWADRPLPDQQTQEGERGVALEYMILLANRLKADPWFCMPHGASHDYVANFAAMVKDRLDPWLKVYVEYSNEVWNSSFQQSEYARRMGLGLGLSEDPFEAGLLYYARRAKEIFQIWEDVFGGSERLVRVLAAQSANPWTSERIVGFEDAFKSADALAIAPYFGGELGNPETVAEVLSMSLDGVLAKCSSDIAENRETVVRHAAVAKGHGLDLIAYEGGQHLAGTGGAENNEALTELFIAANRDPRMKQLYLEALEGWKEAGGGTFAIFASMSRYGKWGSWGLLEDRDQDPFRAPKYQAVLEFMGRTSNPILPPILDGPGKATMGLSLLEPMPYMLWFH